MIKILHKCNKQQMLKKEFMNQIETSILLNSPIPKKFGIPDVITCWLCKNKITKTNIIENIGKPSFDLLTNKVEVIQKKKSAQFHNHEIKDKDELMKDFIFSNQKYPWIYNLFGGEYIKCHMANCNLRVKNKEFINQLGEENLHKLDVAIKDELKKHFQGTVYNFHCRCFEYIETLKLGISELVDLSKINKVN